MIKRVHDREFVDALNYCDVKTLRRREAAIAEDIASGVVYGEGTSFSLVHDPDKDKRNERNRWRGTEKINSP